MKATYITDQIITIDNFWSKETCDEFIDKSEKIGYSEALINTDLGPRRVNHIRNNLRIIHDSEILANQIWEKLSDLAPAKIGESYSIGLNERFRFYKYEPGQIFKKHRDQSYIRNATECSYYTFMIYLNENFEGGSTTFKNHEIKPKTGMCLMFYHPLEHEGSLITKGTKYILRSDIMYKIENREIE